MVATNPPSGCRDFINDEARLRAELIQKISDTYISYGFRPIETPAFENLDVLLGSGGGDENEKLIFKVMKRGEKLKEAIAKGESEIADFGLRFDLTVPLSRVTANYRGEIQFPWKVFHIGPVWRAERAQKGRFREFIQCDVDIVGAKTWAAEVEVIQTVVQAIAALGQKGFELRINDRRLLKSVGDHLGLGESEFTAFAILLDKKDKIEPADLLAEMKVLLGSKMKPLVEDILNEKFSLQQFESLDAVVTSEMRKLIQTLKDLELPLSDIVFDPSLVRGLGYYTGPVFELRHASAGYSFGGGGRYDKLIGRFSKEPIPACGFSIGFERLFLLFKEQKNQSLSQQEKRLFVPVFSEDLRSSVLKIANEVRGQGFEVDVYPDDAKIRNQLRFASERKYRWVLILGEDELQSKQAKLKDMEAGSEKAISLDRLAGALSENLS